MGAARPWLLTLDWDAVAAHELRLTRRLLDGLASLDGVRVVGPTDLRDRSASSPSTLTASTPTTSARCSIAPSACRSVAATTAPSRSWSASAWTPPRGQRGALQRRGRRRRPDRRARRHRPAAAMSQDLYNDAILREAKGCRRRVPLASSARPDRDPRQSPCAATASRWTCASTRARGSRRSATRPAAACSPWAAASVLARRAPGPRRTSCAASCAASRRACAAARMRRRPGRSSRCSAPCARSGAGTSACCSRFHALEDALDRAGSGP
jgi:hypothetical protein